MVLISSLENKNEKGVYLVKLLFALIINFLIALVCFFSLGKHEGYDLIVLLPIIFSLCLILFHNFERLTSRYIGIKIYYYILWIRFALMPLSFTLSLNITGKGIDPISSNIDLAVFIMVIELITSSLIVHSLGESILLKNNLRQDFRVEEVKGRSYVFYFLFVISISLIIIFPRLLDNFSFVTFNESSRTVSYFFGLDSRVLVISKMAFTCISISYLGKLYMKKKKYLLYILALIIGVINIMIFTGENRATIFFTIVPTLLILKTAFPDNEKITKYIILFSGFLILLSLSFYRIFAVTDWRPQGGTLDFSFDYLSKLLQAYLSGPRNIALGLESIKTYKSLIGFETFFSDILIWTGYLGNFLSKTFKITFLGTSYLFNLYIYKGNMYGQGDQIVPLTIQSYAYFGVLGSAIFSMISSYLLVIFDYKICKSKTLNSIYINVMYATVLAMFMGYNISILMLYLFDRYLIFWIFDYINNKFSKVRFRFL